MRTSYIQRWLERWDAYWFPQTTTLNLSVCRIVVVAAQLFLFLPSLEDQINLLERSTGFIDPQILIRVIALMTPQDVFFTPVAFTLLYWVTVVAGITCLVGLFTRMSAFIFALGNWIFMAHGGSYGEEHHSEAILCIFLLLLALSPSGGSLSVDALLRRRQSHVTGTPSSATGETAKWPLKLVQLLLALAYFSTGLAKIVYSGLSWMNGYTLQQYMFNDALLWGKTLGIWLAQQHLLCVFFSIGTIIFELFFFVTLLIPATIPFFLIAGILFHTGIYATMAAPFFQHIALYVVFIDFEYLWYARPGEMGEWKRLFFRAYRHQYPPAASEIGSAKGFDAAEHSTRSARDA